MTEATILETAQDPALKPKSHHSPAAAAEKLLEFFRQIARKMKPATPFSREDIVQEMELAVLECSKDAGLPFFKRMVLWRAKNYVQWTWRKPHLAEYLRYKLRVEREKQDGENIEAALYRLTQN